MVLKTYDCSKCDNCCELTINVNYIHEPFYCPFAIGIPDYKLVQPKKGK